jgi:hypothetical protein
MGSVSTREAGVQVGLAAQQLVRSASRVKTGRRRQWAEIKWKVGMRSLNQVDRKGPIRGKLKKMSFEREEDVRKGRGKKSLERQFDRGRGENWGGKGKGKGLIGGAAKVQ